MMKSTKCAACGFVGWSNVEHCKSCGGPLGQHSNDLPPAAHHSTGYDAWDQPEENQKNGLAIFALILGIVSFFTLGVLGVGAITGIIVASVAMGRIKREPWKYGGHGMALAGLILSITSLVSVVPIGIVASIAVPNLLAARRAANEGSAIHSLRTISSAEQSYHVNFQKYGTLDELGANGLIDSKLASGKKNGYNFTIELTSDPSSPEGFAVVGVPESYRNSGLRSFYVDESFVIRAADNAGGPASKLDAPLEADAEYPSLRTRRADYRRQPVY
jgi:type IV pilus assembly protein PilA